MVNEPGVYYDRLALSAAKGDQDAAAEIFNRLNRFLIWYCGSSDCRNKYDLAQDVWLRIFSKIGTYEPRGRFIGWLKKVARNHMIDCARGKKKSVLSAAIRTSSPDCNIDHQVDHRQDRNLDPEFRETAAICRDAMCKTSGRKLECLELHFVHGVSISDIAMWSNRPVPTIKNRVRSAISDVRGALESRRDSLVVD